MPPQLILLTAQLLLKYGPTVAQDFVILFHKDAPTLDDWKALFAKVKTYEDYAPPVLAPTAP